MRFSTLTSWLLMSTLTTSLVPLSAEIIAGFRAVDGADPRQQGWTAHQAGTGVRGLATDDQGQPALLITDTANEDAVLGFSQPFNEQAQTLAKTYGWRMTAVFRIDECDVPENNSKLRESTAQININSGSDGCELNLNFSLIDKQYGADGYGLVMGVDGTEIHHNIDGDGYVTVVTDARLNKLGRYDIEVTVNGRPRLSRDEAPNNDVGELGGSIVWGSWGSDGTSRVFWRSIVLETVEDTPTREVVDRQRLGVPDDFTQLERRLGARFTVDAPQPDSNMPMGRCAELRQRGTRIAVTAPNCHTDGKYIYVDYAIRNPDGYDSREDFSIYLLYNADHSLHSFAIHHPWLKAGKVTKQFFPQQEGPNEMKDTLAAMRAEWSTKLDKANASRYQIAALDIIDRTLSVIDSEIMH